MVTPPTSATLSSPFLEGVFLFGSTTSAGNAPAGPFPTPAPAGFPTINLGSGTFFDATENGGIDIFFAALGGELDRLVFSTFIGGAQQRLSGRHRRSARLQPPVR